MVRRIVLHKLGEVRTVSEALRDCIKIRTITVRGDLRTIDDPLPNVIHENPRRRFVPLAGYMGNDGLVRGLAAAKKPPQRRNPILRLPGNRLVTGRRRGRAAARESLREGEEQSRGGFLAAVM